MKQGDAGGFEIVHARVLRCFPDLVETLGGDFHALLAQAGVAPADVAQNLTYRQLVDVLEHAAQALSCPDFGMRLAALQGGKIFGPLGRVMKNSRNFGEALDYVVKHTFAHSLAARIWLKPYEQEQLIFSGHDILLEGMPGKAQAMEQLILAGNLAVLEITGGFVRARRVHFRHQPSASRAAYRRYFSCEVRFGQMEDGVFFAVQDMACPIIGSNPVARLVAARYVDTEFTTQQPPLHVLVRGMVLQGLGTDACTNEQIAAALELHPRTLHRKLTQEGTSFQKIKDEVRRDFMLYYIQKTSLDLCRISERLGFAEQSVMSRYCSRWFGASPRILRRKGKPGELA